MKINSKFKNKRLAPLACVIASLLISAGCSSTEETSKPTVSQIKEIKYAIGTISKQELLSNYSTFYDQYSQYKPSETELIAANSVGSNVYVKVFLGTWCHDSVREVPRLLKSFNKSNADIELIALDTNKADPLGLASHLNVKYTPTVIVFKDGAELGRIIERPQKTIAEDIAQFLTNSNSI